MNLLRSSGIIWRGEHLIVGELLDAQLPASDGVVSAGPATVIKSGPHRSVYRIVLPSGPVFLKHYKTSDWRARARNILGRNPAKREAAAAACLAAAGIETTEVAALGIVRSGLLERDSFLVAREVPDVRPLDEFVREQIAAAQCPADAPTEAPTGSRFRRNLACALGRLAGRLHRHRVTHGDFHPANVLARILPGGTDF